MDCKHPRPESFGSNDVSWRADGTAQVTAACDDCGDIRVWELGRL